MGSEKNPKANSGGNEDEREAFLHPLSAGDQSQTLTLDTHGDNSFNGEVSTSKSSEHPLVSPPSIATAAVNSDPLLSPLHNSSLDSPSYADLISDQFHDTSPESNGNGEISGEAVSSPQSQSSSSDYLRISVSNPQKESEPSNSIVPGGNAFITYLITTSTNISDYEGSDFSARRRFKDVVTLSDRLSESYRGFFIPPRPDKSLFESQLMQKQEFLEQRRIELEKYLRRLAKHPMIRKSDELRVFLTAQGKMRLPTSIDMASRMLDGAARLPKQLLGESSSVIEPQDVVHSAKGGRDMLRFFKELKQSVVNDWGNVRPSVEEEDKEFLEKKEKLRNLEQQLTNASKQAEAFVKAQHEMGEIMGELGLAFIKLTKFENEQATSDTQRVRATDMKNVATAAVKASRLYRGLNTHTVKHFDTFIEHMGMMLAMHSAFSDRSSALLTVQTLISELSSLHSRADKLETSSSMIFGGDKARVRKLEDLKEAIRVTEDAKSVAIKEYERIKENNRSEILRLDEERKADFITMLKGFVTSQVSYNEKIGNEWAKVAEETSRYARERS